MAFEVRRRIKGVEITHRDNGGIEKQQGDNDGREQFKQSCHAVSNWKTKSQQVPHGSLGLV